MLRYACPIRLGTADEMGCIRAKTSGVTVLAGMLLAAGAGRAQEVEFIPATPAHSHAVGAYEAIWNEHGEAIVAALETRTCLSFRETDVVAIIDDRTSNSGGPEHPMTLRAGYAPAVKQSTLAHELGHRHLWQLEERLDDVDGHMTLFLVLDLVWQDVWGEDFADAQVRQESAWRSNYGYADAWSWARSLEKKERQQLWHELLRLNGFVGSCENFVDLKG